MMIHGIKTWLMSIVFISGVLFCFTHIPFANATPSPKDIEGTKKITAEKLIEYVEEFDNLIIIDSRIRTDQQLGYIEGSISLSDTHTTCKTLKDIIPSKTQPIIFYCNGPKCGRSANAIKTALKCGYSNTYWFRGGFEEWKNKKYPYISTY